MNPFIPFFSIKRQWSSIKNNVEPKISIMLESNQFVGGPYVATFEKDFANYIGSTHAISCNSGTDALWLALKALDIESNSIVLTTPFSFIASSSEIISHGAKPIFIDIDTTYNISPQEIENWLKIHGTRLANKTIHKQTGQKISGIITVDIFGQCADYKAIKAIAKKWNLWIIEDACQAAGAQIDKQKAGTLGDISCFSLYPTKNLGICGDGGILTTSNAYLAEKLYKLRNHGRKSNYDYEFYGKNSRLDGIQALIGSEKLQQLDHNNSRRRKIANQYTQRLSKLNGITTPCEQNGYHVYHQYCILVDNREELKQRLTDYNIGTNIFYPKALYNIPYITPSAELQNDCPVTDNVVNHVLALPIWPELTDKEVDYICTTIEQAQTKNKIKHTTIENKINQ